MPKSTKTITITYRNEDSPSTVFLAGSFTDPPWLLQQMELVNQNNGKSTFEAQAQVEPGKEYQFKFKIGEGDYWVLDQGRPVATDDVGNQNNVLKIPEDQKDVPFALPSIPGKLQKLGVSDATKRSSTPIEAVANTAAEVADTAETLDRNAFTMPSKVDLMSDRDESIDAEDFLQSPLFAHERLGAYDFADDDLNDDTPIAVTHQRDSKIASKSSVPDKIDMHDPMLEKFPSDRSSIMDALRKIQTSVGADQMPLEDFRASVRRGSREASVDSTDDSLLSSDSLSPVSSRRRNSRLSSSSFGRSRSAVSLGSIAEEDQRKDSAEEPSPRSNAGFSGLLNDDGALLANGTLKVNPESTTCIMAFSQTDQSNDPTLGRHLHEEIPVPSNVDSSARTAQQFNEADMDEKSTNVAHSSRKLSRIARSHSESSRVQSGSTLAGLCRWLASPLCGTKRATTVTTGLALFCFALAWWKGSSRVAAHLDLA